MCRKTDIWAKIIANIEVDPETGCWNWKGGTSGDGRGGGYGRISIDGGTMAVHRVVYTLEYGPIPPKKQIDHKCENRRCCNPIHLEMMTHKRNQKLRDGKLERASLPSFGSCPPMSFLSLPSVESAILPCGSLRVSLSSSTGEMAITIPATSPRRGGSTNIHSPTRPSPTFKEMSMTASTKTLRQYA